MNLAGRTMNQTQPQHPDKQGAVETPVFSIVIPTFNYGQFLRRAIDSVISQGFTNWELVVVDDGSTDGTPGVLATIDDSRVRSIRQPNAGPFAAVQTAFGATSAPWLVVFDADDCLLPGALECLRRATVAHSDAAAIVGPWNCVRSDGSGRAEVFTPPSDNAVENFRGVITGRLRFVTGAAALARSELQRLHSWKAPVRQSVETLVFAHLMLTGRCVAVDQPLLAVYDHPGRLRENLPEFVAAGTRLVDAVFDPAVVGHDVMKYRGEFFASVERERGRTFYRNGCYADAAAAYSRAMAADRRSVADVRTLRRWAVSRVRVAIGKPGMPAEVRADAIARRRRDVPIAPIAGNNFRAFRDDPIGTVLNAHRSCGDVALLNVWGPTILLGHPDDMRHVLVTNAANYNRTRLSDIHRLFGGGLIGERNESHLAQRRVCQPFYTPRASAASVEPGAQCLERIVSTWRDGSEVNVVRELLRLNIGLGGQTVLGIESQEESEALFEEANRILIEGVKMMRCPVALPEAVPIRRHRRYKSYSQQIDARIGAIIDARIARGERDDAQGGDFLDHLLRTSKTRPELLDRWRMVEHLKTMFVASGEPTATPTASALWRLTLHPEFEERLVAEARHVLGDRRATGDDVAKLTFATAFWRETLRLHPSNWLMPRRATNADTLPGGLKIKAGQEVFISQYAMHLDERFFPEPERFDPERFLEPAMSSRPRHTYLPFGSGPRGCIGAPLAEQLGVTLFSTLVRDWRFERVPGGDPVMASPNFFISLINDTRLMLRVRRRTDTEACSSESPGAIHAAATQ